MLFPSLARPAWAATGITVLSRDLGSAEGWPLTKAAELWERMAIEPTVDHTLNLVQGRVWGTIPGSMGTSCERWVRGLEVTERSPVRTRSQEMSCPFGPHTLLGCGQTQGGSSRVRRSLQVAFHWSAAGSPAHWQVAVRLPDDGGGNRPCLTPPAHPKALSTPDWLQIRSFALQLPMCQACTRPA